MRARPSLCQPSQAIFLLYSRFFRACRFQLSLPLIWVQFVWILSIPKSHTFTYYSYRWISSLGIWSSNQFRRADLQLVSKLLVSVNSRPAHFGIFSSLYPNNYEPVRRTILSIKLMSSASVFFIALAVLTDCSSALHHFLLSTPTVDEDRTAVRKYHCRSTLCDSMI